MSKTLFRSRNIETDRPLPIYHIDDLNDLNDYTTVNRTVTQMPTGMEKEEESEHHLKAVIKAREEYGDANKVVIPIPEVFKNEKKQNLLKKKFIPPKTYIKQSLDFQENFDKYDLDSEDEEWLEKNKNEFEAGFDKGEFEKLFDKLEWFHKFQSQDIHLENAHQHLNQPPNIAALIFQYWQHKRRDLKHYHSLIPEVITEQTDGAQAHDPYVAFRRRFEKMQTRKNRKNEEALFEKLLHIYLVLAKTKKMMKLTLTREKLKLEQQQSIAKMFKFRQLLDDKGDQIFKTCLNSYLCENKNNITSINSFAGFGVSGHQSQLLWDSSWRTSINTNPFGLKISDIINKRRHVDLPPRPFHLKVGKHRKKQPNIKIHIYTEQQESGCLFSRFRATRSGQIVRDYFPFLPNLGVEFSIKSSDFLNRIKDQRWAENTLVENQQSEPQPNCCPQHEPEQILAVSHAHHPDLEKTINDTCNHLNNELNNNEEFNKKDLTILADEQLNEDNTPLPPEDVKILNPPCNHSLFYSVDM